ncbi:MAG: glycoside-pentoside-hexuronide (GPH):cation symporter [Clostridia bacterium]|nr:glycoside-pentoside-hexuronide (GPH):cation symporter [Clostridia bacterium]
MEKKMIPKKEFWMYSVGALGQGMIYATMSGFISDYYTNVLMLSSWFVFALMLLARVWDAINDPIMGIIADKYTTKWGKFKPYILFTAIPIAVLTFLMYWCPETMKDPVHIMIYCSVVYVLWGMIYTASDVPFWSLPNAMTGDPAERANTISFGRTLNGIGSAVPTVLYAVMGMLFKEESISSYKKRYLIMAIVASVIGIALFINSYFHVKERVIIPNKKKEKGEKGSLSRIFACKPLMLVIAMGVLSSGRYLMSSAATHVSRYAFDASATGVFTVLQICSAAGTFGSMLFMPMLMKKFDYKKIVIATCFSGFFASIVTTLVGWYTQNFYFCAPFILLQCIPLGVLNIVSYAMIGDCLDYMELMTGYRDTALGSACQGFVNKLGNSFATAGISLMYIYIGLKPSDSVNKDAMISAADLTGKQRFGMFSLVSIIPGISLLLCAIPILFYDLSGEKKKDVVEKLALARKEKGIVIE